MSETTPRTEHEREWLARYGADYPSDTERAAAYEQHQETLAQMHAVFGDTDSGNYTAVIPALS